MGQKVAVIDLGTNTFHLVVSEISKEGFNKIEAKKIAVKVGEGGINQDKISEKASQRAIDTLKDFRVIMDSYGVEEYRAIATSAFRNATNGQALADKIRKEAKIDIEIIPGKREAELIFKGVAQSLDLGNETNLIMDIGGGSCEYIICKNGEYLWSDSFEVGGLRLLELFHQVDPIPEEQIAAIHEFLDKKLMNLKEVIDIYKPSTLVGSSGTFDTLSEIHLKKSDLESTFEKYKEFALSIPEFDPIAKDITSKDINERRDIPGMASLRVEMIVVACQLIKWVIKNSNIENIRVSSYALKEGVLKEMIDKL